MLVVVARLKGGDAPPPANRNPGWYEDIHNPHRSRYWDGSAWQDQFRLRSPTQKNENLDVAGAVPEAMVCTTASLHGHTISAVLGIVTELSATSGFTATSKGNIALADALLRLRVSAAALGANAVVGVSGGPFAARGGVTNALGGDAVGILLMGTAVLVEPAD